MTTVLKLGGSVITDKDRMETLDDTALDRASTTLAEVRPERLVLVHGGGSFGHHHASGIGVTTTHGTRDAQDARTIHEAMTTLNGFVLDHLHERDVPALPIHPLSSAWRDGDGTLVLPAGQVEACLSEGFVPVLHGDVLAHVGEGVTVVSGDELVVELARSLDADRVGVCSTVPGVLDADGEVIDRIDSYEAVAATIGESESTDVTGGMAAKVRALLTLDAPASVFGPDELSAFVRGEVPGTTIE